jgi:D-tyrosyl-tRNA(Tyr) deacylase
MKALIQRVLKASVTVQGEVVSEIGRGLLVFLGIGRLDRNENSDYLCEKIVHLRIFDDLEGKMNLSALDVRGEVLLVSQFTLMGDCRKGRRPGFDGAMKPQEAKVLYNYFYEKLSSYGLGVREGRFQESMQVHLTNDGPVTLLLENP